MHATKKKQFYFILNSIEIKNKCLIKFEKVLKQNYRDNLIVLNAQNRKETFSRFKWNLQEWSIKFWESTQAKLQGQSNWFEYTQVRNILFYFKFNWNLQEQMVT